MKRIRSWFRPRGMRSSYLDARTITHDFHWESPI